MSVVIEPDLDDKILLTRSNRGCRSRRVVGCFIGVVLAVLALGGIFAAVLIFALRPALDASGDFLAALKTEDYDAAYAMLTPPLQDVVGDAETLGSYIREFRLQPESWSFTSQSVENNIGRFQGTVTLQRGDKQSILVTLVKLDSDWKITAFFFNERRGFGS